ncbi:hypothetical protein D3C77_758110 [compost metagenome]
MMRNLEEGMLKIVRARELKERGLRFLPVQVIKRSLRKWKHSISVEYPPESAC